MSITRRVSDNVRIYSSVDPSPISDAIARPLAALWTQLCDSAAICALVRGTAIRDFLSWQRRAECVSA